MYNTSRTFINKSGSLTDTFSASIGILEGDTLAPYLVTIVVDYIDYILRQSVYLMNANGLPLNLRTSSESKYLKMDQVKFVEDSL